MNKENSDKQVKAVDIFGQRLKQIMKKSNNGEIRITQKEMAEAIGITPTMLSYYFNETILPGRKQSIQPGWMICCKIIDFLRDKLGDDFGYDSLFGIDYSAKQKEQIDALKYEIKKIKREIERLSERR